MSVENAIDPALICKLRDGNERAFEVIFHLLHEKVYRFALTFSKDQELSREITQEAFIQLWIHREKLVQDLPLYPYLFTHVRRLTIDTFRRNTLVRKFRDQLVVASDYLSNDTEEGVFLNELSCITEDIVNGLPPRQRLIFRMSRFDGRTYEEIAAALNISSNTVKFHLVCALKTLRKTLTKQGFLCLSKLVITLFL